MRLAAAALAATLLLPAQPKPDANAARLDAAIAADPILRSAVEELTRARSLRTLGEAVYFAEVGVDDAESFAVSASLGSAFAAQRDRLRPVRVAVRVGSPRFDNTNSIFSDYFSGSRFDSDSLPLDNEPLALRHTFWLAFDRAYKTASEALGRKAAALRGVTSTETLPDFWDGNQSRVLIEDVRRVKVDEAAWTRRVKELSAIFSAYPAVTASSVDFTSSQGMAYYLNSHRTVVRTPDRVGMLRVRASMQAPDGAFLYDGGVSASLDPAAMAPDAELRRLTESVAINLTSLAKAPAGEPYSGPVLFSGSAAAQIFAEVFGSQLAATRRPVSDPGRAVPIPISEFESRLNLKVLPEWMDAFDDPTLKELNGSPLLGVYAADLDGVAAERLNVVEKGVLKALFTSRQPVRNMTASNGHARLPGLFGAKTPRLSNLIVSASQSESEDRLKAHLIELVKQQGRPYGVLVRKMDFPSAGSMDDLRRVSLRASRNSTGGRAVSSPILVYRVYADGREELVRGLRFRSLTARHFRDIVAAGPVQHIFSYFDNGAPMALMGAGNYIVGCSVAAPSVLFEDLELEPDSDETPKPPVVPAPPLAASPGQAG